jgi:3-oxoacyl-[acyl-carrier protein] reductase
VTRVALVTGGSGGIGRAVALRLAQRGWDVAVGFRGNETQALEVVGAAQAHGVRAIAARGDLGDPAQAAGLYAEVQAGLGAPDVLVHAAGPYHRLDVLDETPEGWREMMAGNLDSFFYCARLCAPAMIARRWGRIVAFAMANADRTIGLPKLAAHHTAKVGVLVLVRALARALAPHGVTVNAVSPGYIDSGSAPAGELEAALPTIPAGRLGTIDDALAATAFLLSEEAAYITGASLPVSGGWGV